MDSMVPGVAAGRAGSYREKLLLLLHKIDIARHRAHLVVKDFVASTTDALDIDHLDLDTATAMTERMLG